jgi:hypothetical protein
LLEYVVTFGSTLPITLYFPDTPVLRSIEKPLSSIEVSFQERSICDEDTAVTVRSEGGFDAAQETLGEKARDIRHVSKKMVKCERKRLLDITILLSV